jgi:hypothetical protein
VRRSRAPKPGRPVWEDSEEWAYALRERRTFLTGQTDTELDLWQWQGEQKAALLLAVLHLLAARSGRPDDLWLLRCWLTLNAERDVDDVIDRLVTRVRTAIRALDQQTAATRLRHAWTCLATVDGEVPPSRRLHLAAACAHARWLLDAELVAVRGGLLPHTAVRVAAVEAGVGAGVGAETGRSGVVYDLHWLDDGGPPVGYTVRLEDWSTRVEAPAAALHAVQPPAAAPVGRRRVFGPRAGRVPPDG